MKKIIGFSLVIVMCLAFVGCGKKSSSVNSTEDEKTPVAINESELELETPYIIDDYAKIQLKSITTTDVVVSSMGSNITYPVDSDANIYVDAVFDIEYMGKEQLSCSEFVNSTAVGKNEMIYEDVLYCVETDHMTNISSYEMIAPLSTVRFHSAFEIPKTEETVKLRFDFNGSVYVKEYTIGEIIKNVTPIAPGDVVESAEYAKMEFVGVEYTEDLLPSNTAGVYSHYPVGSPDNIYLVVKYNVTNYQSTAKDYDTFVGVTMIADEKYRYTGTVVAEDDDGKGFTSYDTIAPLTTKKMFYMIEVPKTVMDMDYKISILFDKVEYEYLGTAVKPATEE